MTRTSPPTIALAWITVLPCSSGGCVAADTLADRPGNVPDPAVGGGFGQVTRDNPGLTSVYGRPKSTSDVAFGQVSHVHHSTEVIVQTSLSLDPGARLVQYQSPDRYSIRDATDGWDDTERWPTPPPAPERIVQPIPRVRGAARVSREVAVYVGQLARRAA